MKKNIFIINAHQYYSFAQGKLNQELANRISKKFSSSGFEVITTVVEKDSYTPEEEIKKIQDADLVVIQSPTYWMGVPWVMKKYMDEVFTIGMSGALCDSDGRSSKAPKKNYGTGGILKDKKYMLSLTFNAPEEAFNDSSEYLFRGKSVDDLWFPMHMNFRFFAMESLKTFVCYDVLKNPNIEDDFKRLEEHLSKTLELF